MKKKLRSAPVVECSSCSAISKECYRCSECGHDLVDEPIETLGDVLDRRRRE